MQEPVVADGVRMARWVADPRYTALVATRGAELMKVAMLVAGNRQDAEDAVQDAVIAVSAAWPRVTERGAYQYLRTAVVRRAIGLRRPTTVDIDLFDAPVADEHFLRLEQDRQFLDLLVSLPAQQRAVLVLKYYADLDDRTIARTLGCGIANVRSQASRALARLRADLGRQEAQA
ncbi:RNA polymerase sigma factor [Amnibacterium sp.]|uniref:RNA polymerase sigma factor n=1 Tax=Amnibacterium sp. TaxID=1872496 RepID=UPI003F7C0B8E